MEKARKSYEAGKRFMDQGRYNEAIEAFSKATELDRLFAKAVENP